MAQRGRPRTPNNLLEARGSRYTREAAPVPANALELPEIPPPWLSGEAQKQWSHFVPRLARDGVISEADRLMLCVLCDSLAIYFSTNDEGKRGDPKESRLAAENILEICRDFGLTPLARSKNGKPTSPQPVESRKR